MLSALKGDGAPGAAWAQAVPSSQPSFPGGDRADILLLGRTS